MAGAGLIPLSQTTLLQINPPERHGHAMAVFGIGTILFDAHAALKLWLIQRTIEELMTKKKQASPGAEIDPRGAKLTDGQVSSSQLSVTNWAKHKSRAKMNFWPPRTLIDQG